MCNYPACESVVLTTFHLLKYETLSSPQCQILYILLLVRIRFLHILYVIMTIKTL